MSFDVQQMGADEFAESRLALGERVERYGALWWLRTKCVFYQPLLPYESQSLSDAELPSIGLGGLQYVVADLREGNATMGFLMLDSRADYSMEQLSHNRRRLIKNAARKFVIHPIDNVADFKEQGFQAYASFYRRTRYSYKSERMRRDNYASWVDGVLTCTKALVLGGYDQTGHLEAVSISYWIGETLTYSTFFSQTPALHQGVGELMFHALRETASKAPGIREVYVRRYQGGNGMDNYYLMRGARLVVKPARLTLHPLARGILKTCFPARYAALIGETNRGEACAAEPRA